MQADDLNFGFVSDAELLAVLDEYYSQAQKAAGADSYLGVIVGCGAVVEGLLTWALRLQEEEALKSAKAPKDNNGMVLPLDKWSLAKLIEVSVSLGMIGKTASQASWALKEFRNFIHPYNLLHQSARPDQSLAMSALAALGEIGRSLEGHLPK